MKTNLRVGECFMLGFFGYELPKWVSDYAQEFGLGGVILFDYYTQTKKYENNIRDPEQVRELIGSIHALPGRPLVFIDQEGGKVRRLKEGKGFRAMPSQFTFNKLPRVEKVAAAKLAFQELVDLGIDVDLAPVVDLNLNPENSDIGKVERAYSDSADEVRENVELVAEVAKSVGLMLCLKHFPGMGGAKQNSHYELTNLSEVLTDEQEDLFYELVSVVPGEAVLVSHGMVNQWEKELPVSISPLGVGRLRSRCPEALLISDDMQMQGMQLKYGSSAASLKALAAGIDMVIIGNNMLNEEAEAPKIADQVRAQAEKDPVFYNQVQAAIRRVSARKKRKV